jgi:hypothetical protein
MIGLECYAVNDLMPWKCDELCVVFLLESPYENEVLHKHPLAGSSGKAVTGWFVEKMEGGFGDWERDIPFGCHLRKRKRSYGKIGLMNCSRLPMDKSVYGCSGYSKSKKIVGMDKIRTNLSKGREAPAHCKEIEKEVIDDLALRLNNLPDSVLIVPCGNVARAMIAKSKIKTTLTVYPGDVPHPSRNKWGGATNVMDRLATKLRSLLRASSQRNR